MDMRILSNTFHHQHYVSDRHVSIRSVEAALEIRKLWIADYNRILNTRVLRLTYTPGQKGDPTTASLKSLLGREGHRNGG
jgi:hypothetical protein